ncbi:interleukin-5 receptor subunit alpha-like isoform X1 [Bufo gargarizans]|uniref:interleukin-5 receptor subunit alpha-like isoform X1 n=1 Tax=Bufo gargarizans TaxID=30331 RepID=UPI001CF48F98|nr:interleukin-5 receptor subunit alpha-like isoform X1 [Bufo gargarizans]
MACQGNEYLWVLLLTYMTVCQQVYGSVNFILRQPNVTVSNFGFNSVNISWEAEEITERGDFSVCYKLSYQFLDKEKWLVLTTKYHTLKLRMHSRLVGSVSNALCDSPDIKYQSKPAEFIYNAPQVYITNVSCILFNITSLNCSWTFGTDAPDDINYSFALRLNAKWFACPHYLKGQKKNVGCYMKDVLSGCTDTSLNKIRIGFFCGSYNFSKTFRPEAVEILTPPRNIQVLSENGKIIIKWFPPPSIVISGLEEGMTSTYYDEEEGNFLYEIKLIEDKSKVIFRQYYTEKEEQIFTDLVKNKKYYVQIRARHRQEFCKLWGEWSVPVFISKDNTVFPEWILFVIVPAFFAAIAFFLCKRYMKILLLKPIPHPSQNIKNWLYMNGENDLRTQVTPYGADLSMSSILHQCVRMTTTAAWQKASR